MFPFGAAMAYEWLQYMPPDSVYNAGAFNNLSFIMGVVAMAGWGLRDRKVFPKPGWLLGVFIVYVGWCFFTQVVSIVPVEGNMLQWDRAWKTLIFTVILSFMLRSRERVEGFLWVVMFALSNFILSGAVKTVLSGGGGETVIGAQGNILGERVAFAIAVTTLIPIVRYLRDNSILLEPTKRFRMLMDAFTVACVFTTIGTQARTGFVSLGVLSIFYFIKSKRKATFAMMLPILAALVYFVAPAGYFERMNTISDSSESSAAGRIDSWGWGWQFALDHPITGGGYHSFWLHQVGNIDHPAFLEAHNIFVETLADHGFVGLGLMLAMFFGMILNCQQISKLSRGVPGLEWAVQFGVMFQLAMWTFLAGSQFISNAVFSMSYELVALSIGVRGIVERELATQAKATNTLSPVPAVGAGKPIQSPVPAAKGAWQRPVLAPKQRS
jgi:probable O-glycosylation ligase (exosortase A-associated)